MYSNEFELNIERWNHKFEEIMFHLFKNPTIASQFLESVALRPFDYKLFQCWEKVSAEKARKWTFSVM